MATGAAGLSASENANGAIVLVFLLSFCMADGCV